MPQANTALSTIPPAAPADAVFYLPEIHSKSGRTFLECEQRDARKWQVVADIASAQIENVERVIAFDLTKGRCWDASKEIAIDVLDQVINTEGRVPDWCRDFLEQELGWHHVADCEHEAGCTEAA